jgi:uncharacterized protein (TIGR00251 family)
MDDRPWNMMPDGVVVVVRLTPKAGRDEIEGVELLADGRPVLKARVSAPPNDGAANVALIALLARKLGLPASRIDVVAGRTARVKRLRVRGDARVLTMLLAELWGPRPTGGSAHLDSRR